MASIRDVAREAGVSPATVSRTFTAPNLINAQTQQRVLEVAQQLNYRPPRLRTPKGTREASIANRAVSGAHASSDAVGFQFFSSAPSDNISANTFYAPVLAGAQAEASALGMHLLLHTTTRHGFSQEIPRMVQEQTIGGMLLVGTAEPEILTTFARHIPNLLLVDNRDETGTFESVVSDGFGGAYAATRYLIDLGHRERIAFFLPEEGVATFQDRLRGYLCALFENGLSPAEGMVFGWKTTEDEPGRMALIADLLRSPEPPTAMFCANDYHAHLVVRVCRELGRKIPGDLSLVGFDDIEFSRHLDPPLTTVQVDKEFMGRLAVRRLHARLHAEVAIVQSQPSVRHEIPVRLIVRESCRSLSS